MSRILLVEDSRVQALVATRLLKNAGYEVQHVARAEEAVRVCYDQAPDLIVLDQNLAEISGLEVCRRIKNDPTLSVIPVLVLTASDREKDHVAALDAGADSFLDKAAGKTDLLAVVSRLLEATAGVRTLSSARDESKRSHRIRILAVDDSPTFLDALHKKLTEAGFDVTPVKSGAEALRKLNESSYDVAVTDVVMPEMDGFQLCEAARQWAEQRHAQLGLLVLTGSEKKDVLVQALESGADDYVSKSQELDVIVSHATALARRITRARHLESQNQQALEQQAALREAELKRQQAEEKAQLADQLAQANAALQESNEQLKQFAYVASHDLQAPLRRIAGFCDLLQQSALENLDDESKEYLQFISESAAGMQRLISDLLAYSRVGTVAADFEPIDVGQVVDEAKGNLHLAIEETSAEVSHGTLPTLPGLRSQLVQLFQNLIGNAIHYRGETSPRIEIAAEEVDGGWRFEVRDNGIGIAPEYQQQIFQMFKRLHSDDRPGTGIGLATCRKIVMRHGGEIGVESQPGEGSTFYFTLYPPE